MSVGLPWLGWLFKGTNFIGPLELGANDPIKLSIVQTLNNPINIFSFSLSIYQYLKYHQHQYFYN